MHIKPLLLSLFFLGFTGLLFANEQTISFTQNDPPHSGITLSKAIPKEGEPLSIRVNVTNSINKEMKGVEVRFFHIEKETGTESTIGRQFITLSAGPSTTLVEQKWNAPENGFYLIRVLLDPENKISPSNNAKKMEQEVAIVAKQLHFHFWDAPKWMKYPTIVMCNKQEELDYWKMRGVIPARWERGIKGRKDNWDMEKYVSRWTSHVKMGWPAICIDEFGRGTSVTDAYMRSALVESKKIVPDLFISLWITGIGDSPEEILKTSADLVMIERYKESFVGYIGFNQQWEKAVSMGLEKNSILCLGLGRWITTEQELINQMRYIKKLQPPMPGVGFFGSAADHIYQAVDRAIYDYFLKPVLWIDKTESGDAVIVNTGGMDAKKIVITYAQGAMKIGVPLLKAGESIILHIPASHAEIIIEPSEFYSVLK
ncbi:MAG: hypothetical protein WDA18_02635 [Candidatus Ratteibacteria bacterium]